MTIRYKLIFILWILYLIPSVSSAQAQEEVYIQKYPDTLNLRVLWVNKGLNLRVNSQAGDSAFFYGPRFRHYAGFGGFLWNIGFNFLVPLPLSGQDDHIKRFDFQGSLFAKYWLIDVIYQRYKGYYIKPAGTKSKDPADHFDSDLLARKIQASFTYLPGGKKFSLRAPFNQGVQQVKSASSFLLSGGFSYFKIRGQNGILPPVWSGPDQRVLNSVRLASVNGMVGYSGILVHRNFFLHLYGLAGLGFQQKRYVQEEVQNTFSVRPLYDGRAALGYDNGHYYGGIYGIADYASFHVSVWHFEEITTQLRLFVGIRLTEPAFLRRIEPRFLKRLKNSPDIPLPPIFG